MHVQGRDCLLSTKSNHSSTVCAVSFLLRSWQMHRFDELTFRSADHVVEILLEEADCLAAPRWVVGFEVILGAYSPPSMAAMSSLSLVS